MKRSHIQILVGVVALALILVGVVWWLFFRKPAHPDGAGDSGASTDGSYPGTAADRPGVDLRPPYKVRPLREAVA